MDITITIDPLVESAGIKTIARALGVTGTDEELRVHLANHLRDITATLYVRGDKIQREEAENSTAVDAAASRITIT